MSILVYTETHDGIFRKNAFEAVSYAKSLSDEVVAFAFNPNDASELFKYGASKVMVVKSDSHPSPEVVGKYLAEHSDKMVVLSHSNEGATVAPFVAVNKKGALITNVLEAPSSTSPFTVKRKAFSGKGIMEVSSSDENLVVTVSLNAFGAKENPVEGTVEEVSLDVADGKVKVESIEANSGKLDLKEADLVVSGGRGLKGPENWGMVEDLANTLGAATACSKPVSDMDWRPHSEHVGQTGKAIAPNLYIAIGISGAIQHLAGVNASKTIVVINTDPEAPFFKSADYGIVGDAFEVVPKLTEAIKKAKA